MRRALLLALLAGGCAPLTFSHEAAVDFGRYRTVSVELDGADSYDEAYLVEELRDHSGFETVTASGAIRTDLVLRVRVEVDVEVDYGDDGEEEPSYETSAHYEARTFDGEVVTVGTTYGDADSETSAVQDALDELVLLFVPTYRL